MSVDFERIKQQLILLNACFVLGKCCCINFYTLRGTDLVVTHSGDLFARELKDRFIILYTVMESGF